jgi:hypothetical protein
MGRTKIARRGVTYILNSPDWSYNISNFNILLLPQAEVSDFSNYKPYSVLAWSG